MYTISEDQRKRYERLPAPLRNILMENGLNGQYHLYGDVHRWDDVVNQKRHGSKKRWNRRLKGIMMRSRFSHKKFYRDEMEHQRLAEEQAMDEDYCKYMDELYPEFEEE